MLADKVRRGITRIPEWGYNFTEYVKSATVTSASKTFSAVDIGEPDEDRTVFVAIHQRKVFGSAQAITSVTIGGETATLVEGEELFSFVWVYYANVPTGTTADVVITCAASFSWEPAISVGTVYGGFTVADTKYSSSADSYTLSCSSGDITLCFHFAAGFSPDSSLTWLNPADGLAGDRVELSDKAQPTDENIFVGYTDPALMTSSSYGYERSSSPDAEPDDRASIWIALTPV